jgi:uncharacterized protein YndB with AHSA1/START domain
VISLHARVPPVDGEARRATLVHASAHAVLVLDVSGGMMDLGWAEQLRAPLAPVATRFVRSRDVATLVAETVDTISRVEHDARMYASVELTAIVRDDGAWRLARIGGARVTAGTDVVGTEDVLTVGDVTVVSAALVPRGRWRVDRGPGWTFVDESADADAAMRAVRVDVVRNDAALSIAGQSGWHVGVTHEAGDGVANASITIAASRAQVWATLVAAETLPRILPVVAVNAPWRADSAFAWTVDMLGKTYGVEGHVVSFDADRALAYDYFDPHARAIHHVENVHRVHIVLTEVAGGTRVDVTQDGNLGAAATAHAAGGWRLALANLQAVLR